MDLPDAPARGTVHLRGNYGAAAADYTVAQHYEAYTEDEHRIWAELLARQCNLFERYAVPQYRAGVSALALDNRIPDFRATSEGLRARTGWQVVTVPGLIPERQFFELLAQRRFPVTQWIRRRDEFEYLAEPDLFHDFLGHIPLLTDPTYADFIQLYGEAGQRALANNGLKMLARLYWYTVEFGLMETVHGLRCYGAGILSSSAETRHAIDSNEPGRIRFDLQRVLRSDYVIDGLQGNYFVIRSFDELVHSAVDTDFLPLYRQFGSAPGIAVGSILPGDQVLQRGFGSTLQR